MEIYFNPRKGLYEVYDGNHEDGSEPEFEDADFMKCVSYRMAEKGAANG